MLASLFHSISSGFVRTLGLLGAIDPAIRIPLAISLGAIPGALSRYYITQWLGGLLGTSFPYGTFFINLTGALIMGFFVTLTLERTITSPDLRLFFAVGFLGSYTTFSTYAIDTSNLFQSSSRFLAWFYWLGSAAFGIVAVEIGSYLARRLP